MLAGTTSVELVSAVVAVLCVLATLSLSLRSVPYLVARQVRDWERRIGVLETGWGQLKGDLSIQLEQLEQLDASVAKSRSRITTENRRADQRMPAQEGPRTRDQIRRAAAEQGVQFS